MTTSPTLTTHYLPETDPHQHSFPHSPTASEEEMEEKENVNQSNLEQRLLSASVRPDRFPPLRQDDKRASSSARR
jgi:hypothetical protein